MLASADAATRAAELATAAPAWRYHVTLEGSRSLQIEARFAAGTEPSFRVDDAASPFVEQVAFAQGTRWADAQRSANGWSLPCREGCRVRYRFALQKAAEALRDVDTAFAAGGALIAPPSTWLLHPTALRHGTVLELSVEPAPNTRFLTAMAQVPGARAGTYRARAETLGNSSFCAFGALDETVLGIFGAEVRVGLVPDGLGLTREQALEWVSQSATAVARYYRGRLPARHTLLLLMRGTGSATRGETLAGGGPAVVVRAGDELSAATTRDDWVVTHELLHVNFPDLGRKHAWLSEGLATYVEPIARVRAGLLSEATMWRELLEGLPQGQPEAGDQGLENTATWGRTYWGGALFCLLADLTIRERTQNAHSLDDVLRAIAATPATVEDSWSIARVLATGDRAVGVPVLQELYARYALRAETVDLSALFTRLGVHADQRSVSFDRSAPLAQIRASIATPDPLPE